MINAAGAVMVVVFFTFALSGPLAPKEMGVILGVAVLLDTLLVRLLLLPAVLRLLGRPRGGRRGCWTASRRDCDSATPESRVSRSSDRDRTARRPPSSLRAPAPRGASHNETERAFPGWRITDVEVGGRRPDPLARLFQFDERFYRRRD